METDNRTGNTGVITISLGLISLGVIILMYFMDLVPLRVLQYFFPCLIILFGLEIVWNMFRHPERRIRFHGWSSFLLVLILLASFAQFILGDSFTWQPLNSSPVNGQVALNPGIKHLLVKLPVGKVNITGTTDAAVSYSGELYVNDPSTDNANQGAPANWKVVQSGDTLTMQVEQRNSIFSILDILHIFQAHQPYLNIQVPQGLLATVQTSNGSVQAENMNADVDLKSSNGGITAENIQGNVRANTSNGTLTLSNISGSADIQTSNGAISLTSISGTVTARTSNGKISASSAIGGDWDCLSSNGRITLTLPKLSNAKLITRTSNAKISGDLKWKDEGGGQHSSTLGSGNYLVNLRTSNGGIEVDYSD